MHLTRVRVTAVVLLSLCSLALGVDRHWPTWRGPDQTGAVAGANPPVVLDPNESLLWKVPVVGESQSTPVIWADRLYYQTAVPVPDSDQYRFGVVCLDLNTGKTLWHTTVCQLAPHERHHNTASYASFSPVTDGRLVWANFGSRGLYCLDTEGVVRWQRPLIRMTIRGTFGEGSSPCVADDAVVVVCDHEGQSKIFAFEKTSGQPLWQADRDERTSWTTPVAVKVGDRTQVVVNGTRAIRAYDSQTGQVIWTCTGQTGNVIPTPVLWRGHVVCLSGFRGSALQMIRLGATGDLTGTEAVVWSSREETPYVPSPVLMGHRLFFCGSNRNQGVVSCVDIRSGKTLFSRRPLPGVRTIYASFVGAADRVYVASREGRVAVLKNADTFEVLSTADFEDTFDTSPVIVDDRLILKGAQAIYCLGQRSGGAAS